MKTFNDYNILGQIGWNSWLTVAMEYHRLFGILENTICLSAAKVLDIGCGGGNFTRWYVELGCTPKNIVGIDIDYELIFEAQKLNSGILYINRDIHEENGKYDIITMNTSLMCMTKKQLIIDKIYALLNTDGVLVIFDKIEEFNPRLFKKFKTKYVRDCHIPTCQLTHKFGVFYK